MCPGVAFRFVDLSQLTITGKIGVDSNGQRMLNVDPVQVLDHKTLDRCRHASESGSNRAGAVAVNHIVRECFGLAGSTADSA